VHAKNKKHVGDQIMPLFLAQWSTWSQTVLAPAVVLLLAVVLKLVGVVITLVDVFSGVLSCHSF
jgi:hypothetical protein